MRVLDKYRASTRPLVTVDVNPPRGGDISKLVSRVRGLDVDWLNVTDNSGASVKADSIIASYLLREKTGIDAISHITCRDTNRLGLQSRLLGAWMLGVENLLMLTGDRVRAEDKVHGIRGVFDVTSIGLLELGASLNRGVGYNDTRLDGPTRFCLGATADPNVGNVRAEALQLKKKLDAGAEYVLTQPIFSAVPAQRLLAALTEVYAEAGAQAPEVPIFWGILLPKDREWAERIRSGDIHIPGIEIPDHVLDRLRKGDGREQVRVARDVLAEFNAHQLRCIYIIPIGRYEIIPEVLHNFC
ncbi:MAG: methylenetetrahydrofolate reductase [Candidatus Methylomirabilales bacterium]